TNIGDGHAEKLVFRVAVPLHGGFVHCQKPQCLAIENPGRLGIEAEKEVRELLHDALPPVDYDSPKILEAEAQVFHAARRHPRRAPRAALTKARPSERLRRVSSEFTFKSAAYQPIRKRCRKLPKDLNYSHSIT